MTKRISVFFVFLGAAMALPFSTQAQVSYTSATMPECPDGYVCTPVAPDAASSTPVFERVYYMMSGAFLSDSLNDINQHMSQGDILAPQSYTLRDDMTATGSIPASIVNAAKSKGVKIMPLIVNADFSLNLMHTFLGSSDAQSSLIGYLIEEAQDKGYIGWQFDFEHMMASDSPAYSDFVDAAAAALHANGLILSVAAVARVSDNPTSAGYLSWNGVYDYPRLAASADFISMMSYDDPNSIGPAASLLYDKAVLAYLKGKVPPQKISLGVPFYYYGWDLTQALNAFAPQSSVPTDSVGSIVRHGGTFERWQYVRSTYGANMLFDSGLGVPYSTYFLNGHMYQIWYEDATSMQMKLDLAKSNGLRGISAWALGEEFPDVWKALEH